jgi:hypothetical protein
MDRKVIKLETAFGSERNTLIIKRNQDVVVRNIMEEVQKQFKIPIEEQVIFHKGKNLCDFPNESLESLGIENNHTIRITHDKDLPSKSPRSKHAYIQSMMMNSSGPYGGAGNSSDMYAPNQPMPVQPVNGPPGQYQPFSYK